MLVIFSLKNVKHWPQVTWANIFICLLDHACEVQCLQISKWNTRPEKLLTWGRSGTQYVVMVTELLSSYCGVHLVESYCKEWNISDTNWLRYFFLSYLNKIWRHHLANLHILKLEYLWNEKRYLKIVNSIFLIMQSTFLFSTIFVIVPL